MAAHTVVTHVEYTGDIPDDCSLCCSDVDDCISEYSDLESYEDIMEIFSLGDIVLNFDSDEKIIQKRGEIFYNSYGKRSQLKLLLGVNIAKVFCRFHNNENLGKKYQFIMDKSGNRICCKEGCGKRSLSMTSPFCSKHMKCCCEK
jgi:hypothetical protein